MRLHDQQQRHLFSSNPMLCWDLTPHIGTSHTETFTQIAEHIPRNSTHVLFRSLTDDGTPRNTTRVVFRALIYRPTPRNSTHVVFRDHITAYVCDLPPVHRLAEAQSRRTGAVVGPRNCPYVLFREWGRCFRTRHRHTFHSRVGR